MGRKEEYKNEGRRRKVQRNKRRKEGRKVTNKQLTDKPDRNTTHDSWVSLVLGSDRRVPNGSLPLEREKVGPNTLKVF